MEEFKKNNQVTDDEPLTTAPLHAETSYPTAIEKMSEKWRALRQDLPAQEQGRFVERHFLTLGVGIALLIIALIVFIGGFVLLWLLNR